MVQNKASTGTMLEFYQIMVRSLDQYPFDLGRL